jgi:hypothetical protein
MRRRLHNLLTLLSLLLFVAVTALWVRSYAKIGIIYYCSDERDGTWDRRFRIGAHSERGGCALLFEDVTSEEAFARWWDRRHMAQDWTGRRKSFHYGSPAPATRYPIRDASDPSPWTRLGFQARRRFDDRPVQKLHDVEVTFPHWVAASATALLPVSWLYRRWRMAGRSGGGICRGCGYDLRATPARCPECGTDAITPA